MSHPTLPILTRPVLIFSKIFGVFPLKANLKISVIGVVYSLATLMLGFVHLYFAPDAIIQIESQLTKVKPIFSYNFFLKMFFPAIVFITSSVSKINCLCVLRPNLQKFADRIRRVDSRLRILDEDVDRHWQYSVKVLCAIILLIFPINVIRLLLFYQVHARWEGMFLFADMYFHNIASCSHEMQFTTLTYGLVIRARKINDRLRTLLEKLDFCLQLKLGTLTRKGIKKLRPHNARLRNNLFDREIFHGSRGMYFWCDHCRMADSLAELRKIHEDVSDAAFLVQKAYGLVLLFSLCCIGLMLLFDIYFELYGFIGGNVARPSFATYVWVAQYCVRFVLVVEVAQNMYEEGLQTRYLISSLNNRFLDSDSKEELARFMNHITNTRIEFTACDFFTLNSRLITSAIAAGTTYLVILVQFHTDKDS